MLIQFDKHSLLRLKKAVDAAGRKLPQETSAAVNATAKKVVTFIGKEVRTELAAPARVVKKTLQQGKRANKNNLSTVVRVNKTARIPLRDFGARHIKSGVSYRISKSSGRRIAKGAFQGPRPGLMKASWKGNVFRRQGKSRLPIQKLKGPSPWGVFVRRGMERQTVEYAQQQLLAQLERRLKFNELKAAGEI